MDMKKHEFDLTYDWISPYHFDWERLIPVRPNLHILEIGCFEGRSTVWFLQHFPACHITCIDTFKGGQDHQELGLDFSTVKQRFRHNTRPWAEQVTLHEGTSLEMLHAIPLGFKFDIILIDGSHLAADVFLDTAQSWMRLTDHGIIIWDDMGWGKDRTPEQTPAPAIRAFLTCFAGHYDVLEESYQCIIRRR